MFMCRRSVGGKFGGVYWVPESTVVTVFVDRAGEREGWVRFWRKEESAGDIEAWLLRVEVVEKRELERRTWPT